MSRSVTNLLDLSELPAPQRREVHDFVQFLLSKRTIPRKPVKNRFAKLIGEPLIVDHLDIPSRESLYDR
jgi:hypothetical protein